MSVLEVKDLKVSFHTVMGKVEVVKGVDLQVKYWVSLGNQEAERVLHLWLLWG